MKDTELQKIVLQTYYDLRHLGPFQWINEDVPEDKWPPVENFSQLARICSQLAEENLIEWKPIGGNRPTGGTGQIKARGIRVIEGKENPPASFMIFDHSVKITGSPATVVQTGQHNSQTVTQDFKNHVEQISEAIENSNASEISKNEARSLFGEFLKHPLVTSIASGVAGGLVARA
jgi:hypothetical protein